MGSVVEATVMQKPLMLKIPRFCIRYGTTKTCVMLTACQFMDLDVTTEDMKMFISAKKDLLF
jgi:hypothetical protein